MPSPRTDPSTSTGMGIRTSSIMLIVIFAGVLVLGLVAMLAIPLMHKWPAKDELKILTQRVEAMKPKAAITDAEKAAILEYGKHLAAILTFKNGAAARSMVDAEMFADRVCVRLGAVPKLAETRSELARTCAKESSGIFGGIIGCDVKSVRVTARDGFPALLLRTEDDKNGLRFFDVLVRVRDGEVKAVDMYDFAFASFISGDCADTMRYVTDSEDLPPGFADRSKVEAVKSLMTAVRLGNGERAISQYRELPEALKREPLYFRLYLKALLVLSDPSSEMVKLHREALTNAEDILGKDNTSALSAVDIQMQGKDYAGAEASLRATEAVVGRDAYLTTMRALAMVKLNKVEEAERLRDEATAMEPDLPILGELRRLVYAVKKDYGALLADMASYQKRTKRKIGRRELATQPEYADFLKTPEFGRWEEQITAP